MPFRSRKQQRWAFVNEEPWAEKWAKMTDFKHLPMRVKKKKIEGHYGRSKN